MMKQKLSILVIEDNAMMQEALGELLTQAGCVVTLAESGEEIGELAQRHIDVVILDINLPGENGFSIAKRLRAVSPNLGIIMLTARSHPNDSVEGYLHGADNYFSKPFNPQALLAAVQNLGHRVLHTRHQLTTHLSFQLDVIKKNLIHHQSTLSLTPIETLILKNFVLAENHYLEDWQLQTLMENHSESTINLHYVQVTISRLRKKIQNAYQQEENIKNLRGLGYQLMLNITII